MSLKKQNGFYDYGVSHNKKRGIGYDSDEDEKIPSAEDKPKSPFSYHYTHVQTQSFNNARKPKVFINSGRTNHKGPKRFWVPKDKNSICCRYLVQQS